MVNSTSSNNKAKDTQKPIKLNIKTHSALIFILSLMLYLLTFFISKSVNNSYCSKDMNELCSKPSKITVDDKDYMTCKNKIKFKPYQFTYIINSILLPLIIPTIIGSIVYLIYEYNTNNKRVYFDIIFVMNIILIILIIIQFIIYFIFKKSCMNYNYKCILKSELTIKNNLGGFAEYKCVPNINILSIVNYNIIKKINHIINNVNIFIIILSIYLIDKLITIPNDPKNKISNKVNEKLYIIVATIIFIINLLFPNTFIQYFISILIVLVSITFLICYGYIFNQSTLTLLKLDNICLKVKNII
jgi:hypothetical protein